MDSLFDLCEEPPLRKVTEDGDSEDELAATDERKTEEGRTTYELRVVQVATEMFELAGFPQATQRETHR